VAGVRVASRAWWRQAAAMLVCPASLKIAMARLRRVAMVWEPVRVWEASSPCESPHAHHARSPVLYGTRTACRMVAVSHSASVAATSTASTTVPPLISPTSAAISGSLARS
jgi:hypothetical protein